METLKVLRIDNGIPKLYANSSIILCVWFDFICLKWYRYKTLIIKHVGKVDAPQPVNGRSAIKEMALFQIIILGELKVRSISNILLDQDSLMYLIQRVWIKKIIENIVKQIINKK